VYGLAVIWLAVPLLALVAVYAHHRLASARERRRFPPPGRIVDVAGRRVHVHSIGRGSPTVVLDSALAGTSLSWRGVQERIASGTRVVSYDRLGFGWSSATSEPRTAARMTDELRSLLTAEEVPGPYVLVGHSFGGWLAQLFASRYPDDVAGLVLVDAPHPREWAEPNDYRRARARSGAKLARRAAVLGHMGLMRALLWLLSQRRPRGPADKGSVRELLERTPAEIRGPLRSFWVQGRTLDALASQIEHASESASTVLQSLRPMGDMPLIALTAASPSPERLAEQAEIVSFSTSGKNVVAETSGHWIPLDEPELIVAAVAEVLELAKQQQDERDVADDEDDALPPMELRTGPKE